MAFPPAEVISPEDLDGVPFVSFPPDSDVGHKIESAFAAHVIEMRVVLVANFVLTVCEFVAAGHGVSLVHPCGYESVIL